MSIKVFSTWVVLVTSTLISPSTQSCITQWFDHDDPNDGNGDSELLADLLDIYPEQICPNPIDIFVDSVSEIPSSQTFQVYDPAIGFECINSYQVGGLCDDYKVRFNCPDEWCSKCRTPWFNQGKPTKFGQSENLQSILLAYPLQVCIEPIAIEVTTNEGTSVLPNGNFPVYDPTQGFACVNKPLNGWWCQDYKVRFTCPMSFCQPKCVTRWFNSYHPGKNDGDYELLDKLLSTFPGEICQNPVGIEVQTVSGQPAILAGFNFQLFISASGFACTGYCVDYKVRFTCPDEWCSKCRTPWFNQGKPTKFGQSENLQSILLAYPLQVCIEPIAIEVTTNEGTSVLPNGNFPVYDPTQGFACVNKPLNGWWCQDYKVRFICPMSFCQPKCVTRWFDSDNPETNGGDFELLMFLFSKYPGEVCQDPIGIEVQTVSGQPAYQTGFNNLYISASGFACTYVKPGYCVDYKVRFTCPDEWCSKCRTPWFDRDDSSGLGDNEKLSLLLIRYSLQVCTQPIAIEVTTISGTPALPPGNNFVVYDPLKGFECVNGACQDYRVRFTCPLSFCNTTCVSRWFDSDNPETNGGDSELLTFLLNKYPGEVCPNPLGIEAQTVSNQPAYQTGNIFQIYNPTTGFSCLNANQGGGVCADYKVRFTCPEDWCSKCRTPWFDRDDPSGLGDNEKLSLLLIRYSLQVCTQPIAIEVTTISGTPALPPGNIFVVYDPLKGFECVNGACQDYRVRFTCPLSFCNTTCVTRWFDSDNPETNGSDSELLSGLFSMYPGYICPNPIGIEVQTISGQPAYQTGDNFQVYNPVFGFACVNAGQTGGGLCADYKVRFSCPEKYCTSCRTSWFDRDDPDDPGDREILTDIQIIIPPKVCNLPIAIEVTTISGSPALLTGNLFQVFDPLLGFECVNEQQGGGVCQDYKVRYTCPKSFCKIHVLSNLTSEVANMLDKY